MVETILQSDVAVRFIYPFLLIFLIVFAILEKSKILGENKQVNAILSFVIGLIFVSVATPKLIASNMILFMTIAIVIVFVVMVIWGFLMGDKGTDLFENAPKGLKWTIGIVIVVAVALAVLWATGVGFGIFDKIFGPDTKNFWTNVLFIGVLAAALAVVLKSQASSKSS